MKSSFLRKRIGAMLVTSGALSRIYASQVFSKNNFDITSEQFLILSILIDEKELYQRQISEITYKDRPNISRIINILEEKNLVKRVPDVKRRKVFKIIVTSRGKEVYNKIFPEVLKIRNNTVKGIDENELKVCIKVLEKMKDNMEKKVKLHI